MEPGIVAPIRSKTRAIWGTGFARTSTADPATCRTAHEQTCPVVMQVVRSADSPWLLDKTSSESPFLS